MSNYRFCCEECYHELLGKGHNGIRAASLWMEMCRHALGKEKSHIDIKQDWDNPQGEAISILEEEGLILSADLPKGIRIKLRSFVEKDLTLTYCSHGGEHAD